MCIFFYSYVSKNNSLFLQESLLKFPDAIKFYIEKYTLETDRNARILSKLLLLKGLSNMFPNEKIDLELLQTTGKPIYKKLPIHFSSSHSEDLVVVAFNKTDEIGTDIEFKKNIDTKIFKDFLHEEEEKLLQKTNNITSQFYSLWAKKEALIKTSGLGINVDFSTINCLKSEINFNETYYFFTEIPFDVNYACFVSSKKKNIKINCKEIVFL